ncbi:cytochrome P450 6B5-like [Trichoplusia ni]|uniref:unspecific monooxygenase n=1 Tax=Trichoplusia ni TaxID=7111 RepID=A0A7E5VMW3_TRINI|nr:cytochrome P450 6B5-like [Trichoplusia ni]XP_026729655.1 cytochrome P450 6B5-like [Trichoplusia ni]
MIYLVVLIVLVLLYKYTTKNHDYWEKRNVKYEKPIPIFGTNYKNVMAKKSIIEMATEVYRKYPTEPLVGMIRGTTPELVVRDLEIVRRILNVDFAYFYPRGLGRNPEIEPDFYNLFHVDGDLWKLLRQRLTPTFTTAKLKNMFPLVVQCAEKLQIVGEDIVNRGGECDVRDLMARFTMEFIGACGFGIEMDTINDENSLFRKMGTRMFKPYFKRSLLIAAYDLFPHFRTVLQKLLRDLDLIDDVTVIVKNIREQRNYKPIGRNDFIDLLLELEGKGKITGDSIEKNKTDGKPEQVEMEMDLTRMAAQVLVFFAAGFETSSSATSILLHQLAYHPEEQEKIQKGIDRVMTKYNNKLCYDSISEMTALSNGFKEAMRIFPSLGTLHRVCARKYTIPGLNVALDPGVKIIVPLQAIQNDEKYFDNPSQFIPDRFNDPNVLRHKYSYMPFGEGPRACIGARLGEMQSLAGLAAVLHKFSVEPASKTQRYPEVNHRSNTVQSIKGGLPLKLTLRNKKKT